MLPGSPAVPAGRRPRGPGDEQKSPAAWQPEPGDSPPPTHARQPPDGHEFPPEFSDPHADSRLMVQPPSGFGDGSPSPLVDSEQASVEVTATAVDQRRSRGTLDSRERRTSETGALVTERRRGPLPKGKTRGEEVGVKPTVPGRVNVRDKIALFSSPSVEQLVPAHQKLQKHNSLDDGIKVSSRERPQQRSVSDLKLGSADSERKASVDVLKRKKNSDPTNAVFSSTATIRTGSRERETSRKASGRPQHSGYSFSQSTLHLQISHSRDSSTGRSESSEERETSLSPLSERSQSLLDLGHAERRYSPVGLQSRIPSSYANQSSELARKISLNSITEERKKSFSRLRGLIIPNKVDGITKKGPADLPTIKSKALSSSSFRLSSPASAESKVRRANVDRSPRSESVQLSSPPWKADSPSLPKYSPAFKRKNIAVYSSHASLTSPTQSISASSRLGGSSIELSRSHVRDQSSVSNHPSRTNHSRTSRAQLKVMDSAKEPLQRSSSLNSRPLGASVEIRRKISDDAPVRPATDPDVGSSTLTLVNEPLDGHEARLRSRANSVENDHRASTSTLHGSPVKEIDVDEEFGKYNAVISPVLQEEETVADAQSVTKPVSVPKYSLTQNDSEKVTASPPEILEEGAWRRSSLSEISNATPPSVEHRDLAKLRHTSKPSVKSLTQKWQHMSDSADVVKQPGSSRSPSVRSDCSDTPERVWRSPERTPGPESPVDARELEVDRGWPSIEEQRADIDRKLSTPSYVRSDDSAVSLRRERKEPVPSRPQSWVESDRELRALQGELSGYLGSPELGLDSPDGTKSPSSSTSSLLEMLTANLKRTAGAKHVLSVSDLRRAFERSDGRASSQHTRMSSLDSTTSDEAGCTLLPTVAGGVGSLSSLSSTRDHYGSITSLASSTSLISPHELQQLIDDANQSLEESGTPSHEIIVAVLHREILGGSIGVTLAGGADYENKEISVNKVITGSVADRDGRIKKGDRVISINGRSTRGLTHREALNTLKAPRAEVVLVLSRSRSVTPLDSTSEEAGHPRPSIINNLSSRPPKILESPMDSKSLASELEFEDVPRGPPAVITLHKEGAGLGFSLQGGKDSPLGDRPLVAKKIFTGGAADKSGQLQVGDQILAINDTDVSQMARIEAWNFLKKQTDGAVRLTIRKKLPPGSSAASSSECRLEGAAAVRGTTRPVVTGVTPKASVQAPQAVLPKA